MLAIKRTARQRLETFANISRLKPDEETYDLERSVVGSVVAGTTADRCGQCGACDRDLVSVDVGNREDDNVVMMPPLPEPDGYLDGFRGMPGWSHDQVLAYGRACIEAKDAEVAALREALHEVAEEWAGAECGEPVHAQEAYAIALAKRMYGLASSALTKEKT